MVPVSPIAKRLLRCRSPCGGPLAGFITCNTQGGEIHGKADGRRVGGVRGAEPGGIAHGRRSRGGEGARRYGGGSQGRSGRGAGRGGDGGSGSGSGSGG